MTEKGGDISALNVQAIAQLRMIVGYLGEKDQHNWWSSAFLSPSGEAFLKPIFPKTSLLARVNGASAAAQCVHDEYIGVGDVFHLFRLPENVEHDIAESFAKNASSIDLVSSKDDAYSTLEELAGGDTTQGVGPLHLDQNEMGKNVVSEMAAAYLAGFRSNEAVYPYYRSEG